MRVATLTIPKGEAGTAATVAAMIALCRDPAALPELRVLALRITRDAGRSKEAKARAIYRWVRRRIRYVNDPAGIEHIVEPLTALRKGLAGSAEAAEDCDGHAVIIGALCSALGIPVRFVVTEDARNPAPQGQPPWWAHIHAEARCERGWLPLDSSMWWVPEGGRVQGRRAAVEVSAVPAEALAAARARAGADQLGFISQAIAIGSSLVRTAIGARTAGKVAREQRKAQAAASAAAGRYAEREAELTAATQRLESERAARAAAEAEASERLRRGAWTDTLITGGIALAALGGLAVAAKRRAS